MRILVYHDTTTDFFWQATDLRAAMRRLFKELDKRGFFDDVDLIDDAVGKKQLKKARQGCYTAIRCLLAPFEGGDWNEWEIVTARKP